MAVDQVYPLPPYSEYGIPSDPRNLPYRLTLPARIQRIGRVRRDDAVVSSFD